MDDLDDETTMPRGEYDKLHKRHHDKIMADAKKEYYALPREMRQEVMRLHRALAHLPRMDLARILMDAGAEEEIVMWTTTLQMSSVRLQGQTWSAEAQQRQTSLGVQQSGWS